ncbi:MAG: rRNA (cytosine1402-N4)-methyltransferase [Chthoniobacter sp.]|jgi:16S rRNA (cytosine1402-N4)-methyltransferase|nr:rRNA (cytosine1402-N4)-methyltransferase [Chthoniobacter sp.]
MMLMETFPGSVGDGRKAKRVRPAFHAPVLSREVADLLGAAPGKLFVDGTLGGGGHAEILLRAGAAVIGFDQDSDALAFAQKRLAFAGENLRAVHANFVEIGPVLEGLDVQEIDGALLDLGVSSWQIDTAARGFSFMHDGPLDMRMNRAAPQTAADIVNHASGEELERIFRTFGEEPAARRLAARIVRDRSQRPFETTSDLVRSIESVIPRRGKTHPATRAFQALRIATNRELEVLNEGLEQFAAKLRSGARLGVITFHSLEDRIVKTFFKRRSTEFLDRPEWPEPRRNPDYIFRLVTRKAVSAGAEEQSQNPRSRSAKLRVVEKL